MTAIFGVLHQRVEFTFMALTNNIHGRGMLMTLVRYLPLNHIHGPNSCGARWCGRSARGPVGDATEETDWIVGEVMATLAASAAAKDTLVFFTSGKAVAAKVL